MIDPAESARLALYCAEAEKVGPVAMPSVASQEAHGIVTGGPALPGWMAKDCSIIGWVSGLDALLEGWLNLGSKRVFYGWAVEREGNAIVIIRGTQDFAEWAIDANARPCTAHPVQGEVESGFWNLYQTLQFRDLRGLERPVAPGIIAALGPHQDITVTGHSLGAAEATLLTVELAAAIGSESVRGRFLASPRPGNGAFADYFASLVTDYTVYAYERDLVPKVPSGLGYCPLHNLITLPADPSIPDNPLDNHHAVNYARLIDPAFSALSS